MFEKITKGKANAIEADIYMYDGNMLCYCTECRNEYEDNAKFIAYCFNLQQKYDIGMMEKIIDFLQDLQGCTFPVTSEEAFTLCASTKVTVDKLLGKMKQSKTEMR